MKRRIIALSVALLALGATAPPTEVPFLIEATENASAEFPGAPRIHSFALGQWKGRWVFIGGRMTGYHGAGAEEVDFPRAKANHKIWVIDSNVRPAKTYSFDIARLPEHLGDVHLADIKDQWISTSPLFYQDGDTLYIAGGYGETRAAEWVTHAILSSVNLPALIDGVMANDGRFAEQITFARSPLFQSTGGELLRIPGGDFYVIMGHVFMGRYTDFVGNGEKNTGKAWQAYLNQVRRLRIDRAAPGPLGVSLVQEFSDPEFHRRDLNAAHVIEPDGKSVNIGVYGGVFTPDTQLNYSKPIYIADQTRPRIDLSYDQRMSAYSCARLLMFDPASGSMYTTFFGGISRHRWDDDERKFIANPLIGRKTDAVYHDGLQWSDQVSSLIRSPKETREAVQRQRLPGFIGTNAVLIPAADLPRAAAGTDVIDLAKLRSKRTFVGYLYGGIRAFPYKFPFSDQGKAYSSSTVPTRPNDMVLKVYVTVR